MILIEELENRLKEAFPAAKIIVKDLTGTQDHYDVDIISEDFAALSPIQRHRLVYKPLEDVMGGALHALALKTRTPDEAAASAE